MEYHTGCDAHKKYPVFAGISEAGEIITARAVGHDRESYRSFLQGLPPAWRIAVESVGNWYCLIDEMQKAGFGLALALPAKARLMMEQLTKTDKLDARGLAILARNGTLPEIWIPPGGALRPAGAATNANFLRLHPRSTTVARSVPLELAHNQASQAAGIDNQLFQLVQRQLGENLLVSQPLSS